MQREKEAEDHDKTLFDFDHEINDLDQVDDRYPVVPVIY